MPSFDFQNEILETIKCHSYSERSRYSLNVHFCPWFFSVIGNRNN